MVERYLGLRIASLKQDKQWWQTWDRTVKRALQTFLRWDKRAVERKNLLDGVKVKQKMNKAISGDGVLIWLADFITSLT